MTIGTDDDENPKILQQRRERDERGVSSTDRSGIGLVRDLQL
jgi:hypothetical protein